MPIREKLLIIQLWICIQIQSKGYVSFLIFWKYVFSSVLLLKNPLTFKRLFGQIDKNDFSDILLSYPSLRLMVGVKNFLRALKKINGRDTHSILTSKQTKIRVTLTTSNYFKRLLLSISGKMIPLTSCLSVPVHFLLIAFEYMAPWWKMLLVISSLYSTKPTSCDWWDDFKQKWIYKFI